MSYDIINETTPSSEGRGSTGTCFPLGLWLTRPQTATRSNSYQQSNNNNHNQHICHDSIMVEPIFDYQYRIILIGDSTVGKSSLLKYFTDGRFAEVSDPTVGVDFFARLVQVSDGSRIKLQLWDTAGQERFRSITKSYFRNSVGVLLVFDITSRSSFENIPSWMAEARHHIDPHRPVFVLVGCKTDLTEERVVDKEDAQRFAEFHDMPYVETSAKTGDNVESTFQCVAQLIHNKVQDGDYVIQDGWDGIKRGYPRANDTVPLAEAGAVSNSCC